MFWDGEGVCLPAAVYGVVLLLRAFGLHEKKRERKRPFRTKIKHWVGGATSWEGIKTRLEQHFHVVDVDSADLGGIEL